MPMGPFRKSDDANPFLDVRRMPEQSTARSPVLVSTTGDIRLGTDRGGDGVAN